MSRAEPLYDALARTLDTVGPDAAPLYLAKLALALAQELGDTERALDLIRECSKDLERTEC